MPLGPVADAELDAEIDAEPDEKHGEGDGDEVQRSHHPEPDGSRQGEPDHQVDQDGQDDAGLLQREPQHEDDDEDGHGAVQGGAVGDRREFLVRKSDRSGEAHSDAPVRRQAEPGDRLAYGRRRLAAGLEIVEVEDGLDVRRSVEARMASAGAR